MIGSYLLLICASIAVGLTYILNKLLAHKKFNPSAYTFVISFVSTCMAIPLLFVHFYMTKNLLLWILIIISAFIFGLSSYFSFKAYKTTDASLVSLIHKLNVVLAAILGIVLFHESYSLLSYVGLLCIVISNVCILFDGKKIIIRIGMIFAVLMAVTSALAAVIDKEILKDFSPFAYVFVNNILIAFLFSFRKGIIREGTQLLQQNTKLVLFTSALNVGSWAIFLFVLQNTAVSKTFPIYKSLSLIVPVILGIIVLKETNRLWQKIIGTVVGVMGIILLALK